MYIRGLLLKLNIDNNYITTIKMSKKNDEITNSELISILIVEKYFKVNDTNTRYLLEFLVERKIDEILEKENIVDIESFILELHNNLIKKS